MVGGLRYAALADLNATLAGRHDIDKADLPQFGGYFSGFVAETGLAASLGKGFPEEADEDVSLGALGFLIVLNENARTPRQAWRS